MDIKRVADVAIAQIVPRLDAFAAKEVEAELKGTIDAGARHLVCDFFQTEYISSGGLRTLMVLSRHLAASEGLFLLCGLQPFVREVIEVAGVAGLFEICESQEEALKRIEEEA